VTKITPNDPDPESDAILADSIGLALLAALDTVDRAERLAFVLRVVFGLPYDEIGRLVGRSKPAARELVTSTREMVRVWQRTRNKNLENLENLEPRTKD
jgi:RNA polymerase sigma-70 factor (ECF subfamily)